jgi:hypothetical protein
MLVNSKIGKEKLISFFEYLKIVSRIHKTLAYDLREVTEYKV